MADGDGSHPPRCFKKQGIFGDQICYLDLVEIIGDTKFEKKKISWLVKLEIDRFQHLRHKFGGEMTPLGTSNWEMASTLACPSWTNVLQQKAPCAYETSWTIKHQNLKKKHALNLSTIKDAFSEKSWEIHKRLAPKRASSALVAHPRHEAARCPRPRSKCGCGGGTLMGQP